MHQPGRASASIHPFTPARFGWGFLHVFIALLLLGGSSLRSADENVPDLRTLKAQLRRELLTAALPEQKAYRDALQALEKKHAESQDFASALKAREERIKIETEIAAAEKEIASLAGRASGSAPLPKGRIEMKTGEAALTGVRLDPEKNALAGWEAPGASSEWKLPNLPPGGYEVFMAHLGGPISILLKEGFYTLAGELKPAAGGKPVEQSLGTLRIRDGAGPLTLTVTSAQNASDLRVYSLWLVPSAR